MDKDFYQYGYMPQFMDNNEDPMFNPIMQYEQAYSYYKYLCMQMDYKIKCKEYDKLCGSGKSDSNRSDRRD